MTDSTVRKLSLRDRILKAGSNAEIVVLLAEGERYEFVSRNTMTKWDKAATARSEKLGASK